MGLQLDSGESDVLRVVRPTPQRDIDAVHLHTLRLADEQGWTNADLDEVLGMLFDPIKRGQ